MTITANAADCSVPDATKLLSADRGALGLDAQFFPALTAMSLRIGQGKNAKQWIGTEWEGPVDGVVFLLDCNGNRLGALHVGGVEVIRRGPTLPSVGTTVSVVAVTGTGTGYLQKSVLLLASARHKLVCLWKHTALERDPQVGREHAIEDVFRWRFNNDGKVIRVLGRRLEFPLWPNQGPPSTISLPKETYCLTTARVYKQCGSTKSSE